MSAAGTNSWSELLTCELGECLDIDSGRKSQFSLKASNLAQKSLGYDVPWLALHSYYAGGLNHVLRAPSVSCWPS
jgi:hypothetical protein